MYGPSGGPYQGQPQDPWHSGQPAADPYGGYAAPADPYAADAPQDPWGGAPVSPGGYGYGAAVTPGDVWGPPQAPPRRGSGTLVGLVVVLALLLVASAGIGVYMYTRRSGTNVVQGPGPSAAPSAPASTTGSRPPTAPPSGTTGSPGTGPTSDARTAKVGDCLVNKGTDAKPELQKVACAPNTFLVLKRIEGTADKSKCDGTPNLTDWYFYDHPTDNQADFVLCLRRR